MKKIIIKLGKFIKYQQGASAIEYALIAALIAVGVIIALNFSGNENSRIHDNVAAKVREVVVDSSKSFD